MKRFPIRSKPRIGRLPYLSAAPFFIDWEDAREEFDIITAPPRQLGHLARRGELDAACFSLADALRLQRQFEPLGDFGIAARAVEAKPPSPLLCLRNEVVLAGTHPIGIHNEASTVEQLLHIVWRGHEKRDPPRSVPLSPDRHNLGGLLLIGDEALAAAATPPERFPYRLNLTEMWHEWSQLPWVFGRWMVRKELPSRWKERLTERLEQSLTIAAQRWQEFVAEYCRKQERPWPIEWTADALSEFTHQLGDAHSKSIVQYRRAARTSSHG